MSTIDQIASTRSRQQVPPDDPFWRSPDNLRLWRQRLEQQAGPSSPSGDVADERYRLRVYYQGSLRLPQHVLPLGATRPDNAGVILGTKLIFESKAARSSAETLSVQDKSEHSKRVLFQETHYGYVADVDDRVTVVYETDDDEITHEYERSQFRGGVIPEVGQRIATQTTVYAVPDDEGKILLSRLMSYGQGIPLTGNHEF